MRYASFFIRFWLVEDDSSRLELRGIVEHLQSGTKVPFTNLETLAASIKKILSLPLDSPDDSQPTGV
jgi:hypothetical protein